MLASIFNVNISNTNLTIVASATKPDVSLQGQVVWQRLDTIGRPAGLYWFAQGAWLSPHPMLPSHTTIFMDTLPDFTIYDGGDASALSDISGPMWEVAAELNANFPIGVGTLPSTKVLARGDTGGEENHKLLGPELFPHFHAAASDSTIEFMVAGGTFSGDTPNISGSSNGGRSSRTAIFGGDPSTGNPPTDALGHNTLPPYVAVYFLRRTARLFYAVT